MVQIGQREVICALPDTGAHNGQVDAAGVVVFLRPAARSAIGR